MAWFSKKGKGPARPATGASVAAAAREAQVPAPDPGLPEGDLTQRLFTLMRACGLTWVVYGPGSADDCFESVRRVVPALDRSQTIGGGLGSLFGDPDLPWGIASGGTGSVLAIFLTPNSNTSLLFEQVGQNIDQIGAPWRSSTVSITSPTWPKPLADVFVNARGLPVWELSSLAHLRPAAAMRFSFPETARQGLTAAGWHLEEDGNRYSVHIETNPGRSQVVTLAPGNGTNYALTSIIGRTANGKVPVRLEGRDVGAYLIGTAGEYVMIIEPFSAEDGILPVLTLGFKAEALARVADQLEQTLSSDDVF